MVTIDENAKKLVYLASKYPSHNIAQVFALMQLPGIDLNCALWHAADMGWMKLPEKDKPLELLELPSFVFGSELVDLEDRLLYSFRKFAQKEQDPGEYMLNDWCRGYPSHDLAIALLRLIESEVIADYKAAEIFKDESGKKHRTEYTFYTLKENLGKDWALTQFARPKEIKIIHS